MLKCENLRNIIFHFLLITCTFFLIIKLFWCIHARWLWYWNNYIKQGLKKVIEHTMAVGFESWAGSLRLYYPWTWLNLFWKCYHYFTNLTITTCLFFFLMLISVYHAMYLERPLEHELKAKLSALYNVSSEQISKILRQGPTGIRVLCNDEVSDMCLFCQHTCNQITQLCLCYSH